MNAVLFVCIQLRLGVGREGGEKGGGAEKAERKQEPHLKCGERLTNVVQEQQNNKRSYSFNMSSRSNNERQEKRKE